MDNSVKLPSILLIAIGASAALASGAVSAQENARVVTGITFEGNNAVDDFALSTRISTTQSTFWARDNLIAKLFSFLPLGEKRRFNEQTFRGDYIRLIIFYRLIGYPDVTVDTVVERTDDRVKVRFTITEGEPVLVDSISITGAEGIVGREQLIARLPVRVGQAFDRFRFQAARDTLTSMLRNLGYPWVEVFQGYDWSRAERRANLSFEVLPGPVARLGDITVLGAQRMDTAVVARHLGVRPGRLFSANRLIESQRSLYRLGVFRFANVGIQDTVPPPGAGRGDTVVTGLGVALQEGRFRRVQVGTGFGTLDCFRVQSQWTERNFIGGARTLDLTGRLSKLGMGRPTGIGLQNNVCGALNEDFTSEQLNFALNAAVTQPWVFSTKNRAVLSLFGERRGEFKAFLREAFGASIAFTREFRSRLSLTLSYELSGVRTRASEVSFCVQFNICSPTDIADAARFRRTGVSGFRASYDAVDNVLDPTAGTRIFVQLFAADRATLSDSASRFTSVRGEVSAYYPVGRRSVLSWRLQGGVVFAPAVGGLQAVPPDRRLYTGGPNSIRGFSRNEMGPLTYVLDEIVPQAPVPDTISLRASPIGGNALVVGNLEYRFPTFLFPQRFRAAVYVDAGQVWERGNFPGLRITPGIGGRISTPIGPVRIDVAWNPYDLEPGTLFEEVEGDGNDVARLEELSSDFRILAPDGFFDKLTFQFSIGQAF